MARYSVLKHYLPPNSRRNDHFDLLIECQDALATWEIQHWPPLPMQSAIRLPDHRLLYLDYEGSIEGRGTVTQVCTGEIELRTQDASEWIVQLMGQSFHGVIHLRRESCDVPPSRWTLSAEPTPSEAD